MASSVSLTPQQRSTRARCAAFALHAQGGTNTVPANRAFLARFEAEVDPDNTLPPDERARRAQWALKAHMARLALAASRSRSHKKAAPVGETSGAATAEGQCHDRTA